MRVSPNPNPNPSPNLEQARQLAELDRAAPLGEPDADGRVRRRRGGEARGGGVVRSGSRGEGEAETRVT